jgi:hypothetical protein
MGGGDCDYAAQQGDERGTGEGFLSNVFPGALHALAEVRQDAITTVGGSCGEQELEMVEQSLEKKSGGDIAPAEETPASSFYRKDKEGRKNESAPTAEPKTASAAPDAPEQAQSTFPAAATADASASAATGQHAVAGPAARGGHPRAWGPRGRWPSRGVRGARGARRAAAEELDASGCLRRCQHKVCTFSKVSLIVRLYSRYSRALTFENL